MWASSRNCEAGVHGRSRGGPARVGAALDLRRHRWQALVRRLSHTPALPGRHGSVSRRACMSACLFSIFDEGPCVAIGAAVAVLVVSETRCDSFVQSSNVVWFLIYPGVSAFVFKSFKCTDFGEDGNFLSADLRVDCDSDEYQVPLLS
eukprot:2368382-Rhodomonas_salina.5